MSGRVIIATAATLSLLLIGVLAVSMTPGRSDPETISSTTSRTGGTAAGLAQPRLPIVTPIGDDGWAITTTAAVKAHWGRMSARLPSGEAVDVAIVSRDEDAGLTVVSLPSQTSGYHLARNRPAPTDMVAVEGRRTQVVQLVKLATLDVEEAAPVLDDDGELVGLCSWAAGTVEVRPVSTMPAPPSTTTATAAPSPTAPPVTPPATTVRPASKPAPAPTTVPPTTASRPPTSPAPTAATTAPPPTTSGDAVATTAAS